MTEQFHSIEIVNSGVPGNNPLDAGSDLNTGSRFKVPYSHEKFLELFYAFPKGVGLAVGREISTSKTILNLRSEISVLSSICKKLNDVAGEFPDKAQVPALEKILEVNKPLSIILTQAQNTEPSQNRDLNYLISKIIFSEDILANTDNSFLITIGNFSGLLEQASLAIRHYSAETETQKNEMRLRANALKEKEQKIKKLISELDALPEKISHAETTAQDKGIKPEFQGKKQSSKFGKKSSSNNKELGKIEELKKRLARLPALIIKAEDELQHQTQELEYRKKLRPEFPTQLLRKTNDAAEALYEQLVRQHKILDRFKDQGFDLTRAQGIEDKILSGLLNRIATSVIGFVGPLFDSPVNKDTLQAASFSQEAASFVEILSFDLEAIDKVFQSYLDYLEGKNDPARIKRQDTDYFGHLKNFFSYVFSSVHLDPFYCSEKLFTGNALERKEKLKEAETKLTRALSENENYKTLSKVAGRLRRIEILVSYDAPSLMRCIFLEGAIAACRQYEGHFSQ